MLARQAAARATRAQGQEHTYRHRFVAKSSPFLAISSARSSRPGAEPSGAPLKKASMSLLQSARVRTASGETIVESHQDALDVGIVELERHIVVPWYHDAREPLGLVGELGGAESPVASQRGMLIRTKRVLLMTTLLLRSSLRNREDHPLLEVSVTTTRRAPRSRQGLSANSRWGDTETSARGRTRQCPVQTCTPRSIPF